MSAKSIARQIAKRGAPKGPRAGHGQWVDPAKAVYELMKTDQWNVSDAVREVVKDYKFKNPNHAFNGVRAAYYVLCKNREDFEI